MGSEMDEESRASLYIATALDPAYKEFTARACLQHVVYFWLIAHSVPVYPYGIAANLSETYTQR
jgi:hypothetical protein